MQGRNISKWKITKGGENLLFIPWHFPLHENPDVTGNSIKAENLFKKEYPSIYSFISKHKKELSARNKEETGIRYEWYALQRCAASYYLEFDKAKIVWGLTADKWAFAYDDEKHYLPSNGYILTSEWLPVKYILSVLNSKLMQFYFSFSGIMTAGGAYTLKHETIKEMPVKELKEEEQIPFISLTEMILFLANNSNEVIADTQNKIVLDYFEQVLNGCVYELYFPDEMKKAGVEILELVAKDLESVKKLSNEKAIAKLYEQWQESKNEIRNRLLLMATRCPETIGIIEESVS